MQGPHIRDWRIVALLEFVASVVLVKLLTRVVFTRVLAFPLELLLRFPLEVV